MDNKKSIGIVGEGSWATALVKLLQNNSDSIVWAVRDEEMLNYICANHHNPNYLSDVEIDTNRVAVVSSVKEVVQRCDILLIVLPSAFIESSMADLTPADFSAKYVFSATKGIIPSSNKTVCTFIHEQFHVPFSHLGFISGPSHAEEIALERQTFLTVLSENAEMATYMADNLRCRYLTPVTNHDLLGAEYASAMKNVMAIATGVCHGLGYGDNQIAVLVSNAMREIGSFLDAMAPAKRNLLNYVYLGDLLVTCYSQFSRNRTLGTMLGKGYTVKSAQLEMNMVAEGYYAAKSIYELGRDNQLDLPLVNAVYMILYERISPVVEMKLLTNLLK